LELLRRAIDEVKQVLGNGRTTTGTLRKLSMPPAFCTDTAHVIFLKLITLAQICFEKAGIFSLRHFFILNNRSGKYLRRYLICALQEMKPNEACV
jgi:hypothetical protein